MPDYAYAGPEGRTYPSLKDSAGVPAGTPAPGEIRPFPEPPDRFWRAASGEDEARLAAERAEAAARDAEADLEAAEDPAGAAEGDAPAGPPAVPVPAPPAVPAAPAQPATPAVTIQEG